MISPLIATFGVLVGVILAIFAVIFVGVPVLKVIGTALAATLRGIGWVLAHLATFVVGMLRDAIRLVGALIATILFVPIMAGSVVIGRWSAASHFASSIMREIRVAAGCTYRVALQRPLRLLLLDGLLEGVEQRVPEAVAAAPGRDQPSRRTGQFPGYTIVGSLRPGGSGAKLYVAEPDGDLRARRPGMPAQVVIKTFAITDGSSLPQIVRESRALDSARQMGLILDHGLDEQRFFYVMPYHAGESLGTVARQIHGESDAVGLTGRPLQQAVGYVVDLVETLDRYHRGGLWHKDVKPENIIVHAGRAHLVDLGLVTPLRSAMTLTTHGTEYFRDPEMVRLALRGVKVHQVDGAKFDIYACGAVLYFMLENTFPAHGGLSAFSKRSPEALRWIVRRAMADYSKRYERADVLLADLRHVAAASDPFSVRPADLPSLRGETFAAERAEAWSAAPTPPPAPAGAARHSPVPPPPAVAKMSAPPRLTVTNWWTGAYIPAGAAAAAAVVPPAPAAPSGHPHRHAPEWLGVPAAVATVEPPPPPPTQRSSAAAQRSAARRRAMERQQAAARHVAARLHRPAQPSKALVVITLLVIAVVVGATVLGGALVYSTRSNPALRGIAVDHGGMRIDSGNWAGPIPRIELLDSRGSSIAAADAAPRGSEAKAVVEQAAESREPLRAILVNSHPDPAGKATVEAIDQAIAGYRHRGYTVCTEDVDSMARLAVLLPRWAQGDRAADAAIEDLLDARQYYAVVWLTGGKDSGHGDVDAQLVHAERAGAKLRRGACHDPATEEAVAPEPAGEPTPVAEPSASPL